MAYIIADSLCAHLARLREVLASQLQNVDPKTLQTGAALTAGTGAILAILWQYNKSRMYNYPPAPPGGFLVGNALQVGNNFKHLHLLLTEWSKQYGDIFTMNMLNERHLVISGKDAVREATFQSADLNDRPYFYRLHYLLEFQEDITFGQTSPKWATMKKSALHSLKTYSDGLQRVETFSHNILTELLDKFDEHCGEPFNPRWEIRDAISNFMSWLTFGEELTREEILLTRKMSSLTAEAFNSGGIGSLLDLAPWLRFIPNQCIRLMDEAIKMKRKVFDNRLIRGKANYDPNDIKCALDSMIKQQPETKLDDNCLKSILLDMIGAGTDTTSVTLHFFVALMAAHPDIQKKAQKAIDKAIGDRLPLLIDKGKLPYIEAMAWETLRYLTPAPLFSRRATKDTTFRGYHIPKDTMLWINVWSMHYDEEFWDAPTEFRPERFLDDDGNIVPPDHPNRTNIMPFGAGRRVCIGETLARNRLFLFTTAFLQRFTFEPESPDKLPPVDPKKLELGLLLLPTDFNIRAIPREK